MKNIKRYSIILIIILIGLIGSSCGLLQPPAPLPQLSATDFPPKATAMSELPPTWTLVPTLTPSATLPPSPTPMPTQDPENYQIGLAMTPIAVGYSEESDDLSGWNKLAGQTASMSIPPSYQVLDFAGVFMELMFGVMEAFVEGFTDLAVELGEEMGVTPEAEMETPDLGDMPALDFLIAVEETTQSAIILVSVEISSDTTTEDLINQALSDTNTVFEPLSREEFLDAPYPMERIILDVLDEELGPGKQIIYVILGEKMGWNVVFTTPADQFPENLLLFERAIRSFTVLD